MISLFSPLGTSATPGSPGAGSETGEGDMGLLSRSLGCVERQTPVETMISRLFRIESCGRSLMAGYF